MQVLIRSAARQDILRQFSYYLIEQAAAAAVEKFLDAIERAIELLSQFPTAGNPKSFKNPRLAGLRSLGVRGFPAIRIYYLVAEDELRIVRVLHGKRDINPLLED